MSETVTTVRKDRIDSSLQTHLRDFRPEVYRRGPTHIIHAGNQTWCGRKIKGISTWKREDDIANVDCKVCLKAMAENKPKAWKRY